MTTMTAPPAPADAPAVDLDDLTARLRLGVTRVARKLRQQSGSGLTPSQLSALAAIRREGPLTLGALADVEHVAPPSITKVVDKLAEQGLVERQVDPNDGRIRLVHTTEAGEALLAETRARKDAWLATRLADLGPDDLDSLQRVVVLIEALAGQERDDGVDRHDRHDGKAAR
jgi:DNA-binding MarR family transcriptional regulator